MGYPLTSSTTPPPPPTALGKLDSVQSRDERTTEEATGGGGELNQTLSRKCGGADPLEQS